MIGQAIGHYKIVAKLGEGGMGEVYRAEDSQLEREVAIKVLPEAFKADSERLARFEREAKVLASLNHPNIAAIYGLEQAEGRLALVMELVEGETLAEVIARGPVGSDQAIPAAVQIAQALEAAHDKGVIHRDLKPANVKITPEGTVKVLDFGLAKATEPRSASGMGSASMSPTLTQGMTAAGIILGTASYMSPEQARGQVVDKRSDIWSFGSVLFEMLTGKRAFAGETVTDILAAIVHKQLEWSELPEATPAGVRKVLHRCLENDPKQRLHDIADARIELQEAAGLSRPHAPIAGAAPGSSSAIGARFLLLGALVGLVVGFGVGLIFDSQGARSPEKSRRLSLQIPTEFSEVQAPTLSSGGDFLVFLGLTDQARLYERRFDDFTVREIEGTEGVASFALSPDGQWIAFLADDKLKKVNRAGGSPIVLTDVPSVSPGVRWGQRDTLWFTPGWVNSGLYSIPAAGGEVKVLTEPDFAAGELAHWWPEALPGEEWLLFTLWTKGFGLNDSQVAAFNLESGAKRILFPGAEADYLPSGYLLYYRGGSYFVAPFDPVALERTGADVLVLIDAARRNPNGSVDRAISVSDDGTLAYVPHPPMKTLSWFDLDGTRTPWPIEPDSFRGIASSPVDSRVAATLVKEGAFQIWVVDPDRRTLDRFDPKSGSTFDPVWHPDGEQIAYGALHEGTYDIFLQAIGEEPEVLLNTGLDESPDAFTPDGSSLIYNQYDESGDQNVWAMDLADPKDARLIAGGPTTQRFGRVSPDGAWIAYESSESGRQEIYVQPFLGPGSRTRVSTRGGGSARWAVAGSDIFFVRGRDVVGVPYKIEGDRFALGEERVLFQLPVGIRIGTVGYKDYDVTADGRFVVAHPVEKSVPEIRIITRWTAQFASMEP